MPERIFSYFATRETQTWSNLFFKSDSPREAKRSPLYLALHNLRKALAELRRYLPNTVTLCCNHGRYQYTTNMTDFMLPSDHRRAGDKAVLFLNMCAVTQNTLVLGEMPFSDQRFKRRGNP